MYKNLINRIFSLPRIFKVSIILFLDLFIVILSSYFSLAIRLDEINLLNVIDARYLISVEYFLIPIFVYFSFAISFQFYGVSFRYYNILWAEIITFELLVYFRSIKLKSKWLI